MQNNNNNKHDHKAIFTFRQCLKSDKQCYKLNDEIIEHYNR